MVGSGGGGGGGGNGGEGQSENCKATSAGCGYDERHDSREPPQEPMINPRIGSEPFFGTHTGLRVSDNNCLRENFPSVGDRILTLIPDVSSTPDSARCPNKAQTRCNSVVFFCLVSLVF